MSAQSGVPVVNDTDLEETDPVIAKLQKTGCLERHYAVLVCMFSLIQPFNALLTLDNFILGMLG